MTALKFHSSTEFFSYLCYHWRLNIWKTKCKVPQIVWFLTPYAKVITLSSRFVYPASYWTFPRVCTVNIWNSLNSRIMITLSSCPNLTFLPGFLFLWILLYTKSKNILYFPHSQQHLEIWHPYYYLLLSLLLYIPPAATCWLSPHFPHLYYIHNYSLLTAFSDLFLVFLRCSHQSEVLNYRYDPTTSSVAFTDPWNKVHILGTPKG